jgi:hypothetical protein
MPDMSQQRAAVFAYVRANPGCKDIEAWRMAYRAPLVRPLCMESTVKHLLRLRDAGLVRAEDNAAKWERRWERRWYVTQIGEAKGRTAEEVEAGLALLEIVRDYGFSVGLEARDGQFVINSTSRLAEPYASTPEAAILALRDALERETPA